MNGSRHGREPETREEHPPCAPDETVWAFRLEDSLGFMARRLNSLASALFAETSGQSDVTAMQMGVLLTIYQARLITLPSLGRKMRVDRSTLQELVRRLVARGFISRRNPSRDRRIHELWLTESGSALVLSHLAAMTHMQTRLLEGLAPADADAMLRGIRTILAHHDY
jgi:DNA-binding MarR family transcriptional regulator